MTGGDSFASRVVRWQRRHGRHDLPWQQSRDPYRVWLSEVMLQQTQVSTVLGYYQRFLDRFPDVAALAAAPLDDVLALWSGLGYYSRARMLHRCALQVVVEHGGRFPPSAAALATLPGIGRSTAAAIAAFCFGERAAILDGNVKRVLTRHLGFGDDLAVAASQRQLWALVESLLPDSDVDRYTQGLMDLGATLCLARTPRCDECPVAATCRARAEGQPQRYPVKLRRLKRGSRSNALLWLQAGDAVWLVQRPGRGVWASLWSLPEFESIDVVQALTATWPGSGQAEPEVMHALTHFDWRLQPWRHRLPEGTDLAVVAPHLAPGGRWLPLPAARALGLPAPVRKLLG